ncbi:MAG TPA: hypothetical protein VGQ37_25765 [Vicinamibacterales bacterium]|jgi:hypothetical protein|nr:hypothetical protein [Vicinamibacterales bacterium]
MSATGSRLRRLLSSPFLYGGWAVFVVAALVVSYPVDPYVFAFTALILAWVTGAIVIAAVAAVALWAWDWSWRRRLLVVAPVALAVVAVAQALAVLRTFTWN